MSQAPFPPSKLKPFQVGPFEVKPLPDPQHVEKAQTPSKNVSDGWLYLWDADTDGAHVRIAYGVWDNGDRGVQPVRAQGGNDAFRYLHRGSLRFSIRPVTNGPNAVRDRLYAELAQARIKSDGWIDCFRADEAELDEAAGLRVGTVLEGLGARAFGRAEDVAGVTNRHKNYCAVVFDADEPRAAVAGFILTRALPLLNEYTAD